MRARYLEGAQVLEGLGIKASASGFLWTFALVNLVLFVAAMLAAYLAYVPRVRDLAQRRRLVRREIHVAERALEREEKVAEQLAVQMARSRVEREKLLDAFQLKIRSWEDMYQEAWEIYRDANVRARLKAGIEDVNPDSFGEYPQIKAEARPPVSLDWGCDKEKTADTGNVEQGVARVVSGNPS